MAIPPHPKVRDLELTRVLHTLSDPIRLEVVRRLAAHRELTCGELCGGRPKSSMSHHFCILIDAGILQVTAVGTSHRNTLRMADLEQRFPGLMLTILLGAC